jgi:hypothetical protein
MWFLGREHEMGRGIINPAWWDSPHQGQAQGDSSLDNPFRPIQPTAFLYASSSGHTVPSSYDGEPPQF